MDKVMLVVDDVIMNREVLKVLFRSKYEILEAENGVEALEVLEKCQGNIDIVLLDLLMPDISGFEILEKRKELEFFKQIPVIVITSSGQMEDQIEAFELGANDYITKPFIPEVVISRVNNLMDASQKMLSMEIERQKLKVKSELDEMTKLYNKMTTEFEINQVLMDRNQELNVLLVIDIDNFKIVNDTSGHQEGDCVIKSVAELISRSFRKSDIVGRIGGDEFCVLMVDVPSMNVVYDKANELIQFMRYKINMTIPDYVTISIGVASNQRQTTTYQELFYKADCALYDAKMAGKAKYREYGVLPVNLENDVRPVVVLVSENRNVCSAVHAFVPEEFKLVGIRDVLKLKEIEEKDKKNLGIVCVDLSEIENVSEYLAEIEHFDWIKMNQVLAICQEGNVLQYMEALKKGVVDMLTTPIDGSALKRRLEKILL